MALQLVRRAPCARRSNVGAGECRACRAPHEHGWHLRHTGSFRGTGARHKGKTGRAARALALLKLCPWDLRKRLRMLLAHHEAHEKTAPLSCGVSDFAIEIAICAGASKSRKTAAHPVDPPPTPSAHVSHRTRGARSAPERASSEGRRFRLTADVENQGLAMCW